MTYTYTYYAKGTWCKTHRVFVEQDNDPDGDGHTGCDVVNAMVVPR